MKKVYLLLILMLPVVLTSCITGCLNVKSEQPLPLAMHHIDLPGDFSRVDNSLAVDVEFTQENLVSATLICPAELKDFIVLDVAENQLTVRLSEELDETERADVNNMLGISHSKLLLSAPELTNISVRGLSMFSVMNDLRTSALFAELSGSGDIKFNGVQSDDAVVAVVNGSGDVEFGREIKAKRVEMNVNGSGDMNADVITAYNVSGVVNGSGDVKLREVAAVWVSFGVNGSGDLCVDNVTCEQVKASVNGSGDLKMKGLSDSAMLTLASSGDLDVRDLSAKEVVASVVGSGTVVCNAEQTLSASVAGSGEVRYLGNPSISTSTPMNVKAL